MNEAVQDMLARLSGMSRGEPTWDLSDNDCASIKWLLAQRQSLQARVRELEQALQLLERVIVEVYPGHAEPDDEHFEEYKAVWSAVMTARAALHVTDKAAGS